MATKKKTKKRARKSKKIARRKAAPAKAAKRPRKLARKKSAPKKAPKKKIPAKRRTPRNPGVASEGFAPGALESRPGAQSGDFQGLSRRESANSESVEELLEEGNAFEAEAVSGVEEADDAEEREVRTHELPEDDVPEEYLDKD